MEALLNILNELHPEVDFETATGLIDDKVLDSFEIVTLVSEIADAFDITISAKYLVPKYFNSAQAMWDMICAIREEDE